MSYSLGVDLGATTCAAAAREGAALDPRALGEQTVTMPAVVLPLPDGTVLVGDAADRLSKYEPTLVARMVASRLGEPGPIVIDGEVCDPVALTETLLAAVIDRAAPGPGAPPAQVVVTFPLRGSDAPERVLAEAAARVTGGTAMLVPEPIAAVAKLAHDRDIGDDTVVAVVDAGGSSVDVTLVRRTPTAFDLVGDPATLAGLGGADLDGAMLALVEGAIGDVTSMTSSDDRAGMLALRRLRAACRAAKERLSTEHAAVVEVALPHARAQVEVTREAFERAVEPHLDAAGGLVLSAVEAAGLIPADLGLILLTGGSAHIPRLAEVLTERTGVPLVADDAPELTVALGAALFGDAAEVAPGPAAVPDPSPLPADPPPALPLLGAAAAGVAGAAAGAAGAWPDPPGDDGWGEQPTGAGAWETAAGAGAGAGAWDEPAAGPPAGPWDEPAVAADAGAWDEPAVAADAGAWDEPAGAGAGAGAWDQPGAAAAAPPWDDPSADAGAGAAGPWPDPPTAADPWAEPAAAAAGAWPDEPAADPWPDAPTDAAGHPGGATGGWTDTGGWADQPADAWDDPEPDPRWEDSRTSVFDPAPPSPAAAAAGEGGQRDPDDSDEFQRLTTSDTDPFGARGHALSARRLQREDGWEDEEDDGRSPDVRLVIGAVLAAVFVVLLGGFVLLSGTGDSSGDQFAVADTVATTSTTSTSTSTTTTAPPTTTTAPTTTTTEEEETTTTTWWRPDPTTTTAAPPPPPPSTTPTTRPRPTTTTAPTTTTTASTTTTTTDDPD
jgi:hypothetical protein